MDRMAIKKLRQVCADIALTTLIDLQSYGRNIGIISHVSELKERIRPKIEVYTKDNYAKVKMPGI